MVDGRVHRMTELFGRLAPGQTLDAARAELRAVHGAIVKEHPEAYSAQADFRIDAKNLRDEIISPARTILLILLAASALVFIVACSNVANLILARSVRREGELAVRAALGASTGALRRTLARRKSPALRRRRRAGGAHRAADGGRALALRVTLLGARARRHRRRDAALGRRRPGGCRRGAARVRAPAAVGGRGQRDGAGGRKRPAHLRHESPSARLCGDADRRLVRAGRGRGHAHHHPLRIAAAADRVQGQRAGGERADRVVHAQTGGGHRLLPGNDPPNLRVARCRARRERHGRAVAGSRILRGAVHGRGVSEGERRRRSSGEVPNRFAGILRNDWRADHRRPRLRRERSARRREGGDGQREPGPSHVPRHGCGEPPADVDRPGDEVHRRQHRTAPDRRCRSRHR